MRYNYWVPLVAPPPDRGDDDDNDDDVAEHGAGRTGRRQWKIELLRLLEGRVLQ